MKQISVQLLHFHKAVADAYHEGIALIEDIIELRHHVSGIEAKLAALDVGEEHQHTLGIGELLVPEDIELGDIAHDHVLAPLRAILKRVPAIDLPIGVEGIGTIIDHSTDSG